MFTWWSVNVCGSDAEALKKLGEEIGAQLREPVDCSQVAPDAGEPPHDLRESEHPQEERVPGGSSDV